MPHCSRLPVFNRQKLLIRAKEKGPPRRWGGPFLNYGGGSVRISTLRFSQPRAASALTPISCPDTLLQYLMMHWITSFQNVSPMKAGWHRFGLFQVKISRRTCLGCPRHHSPNNNAEWHQSEQCYGQFHAPIGNSQRHPQRDERTCIQEWDGFLRPDHFFCCTCAKAIKGGGKCNREEDRRIHC